MNRTNPAHPFFMALFLVILGLICGCQSGKEPEKNAKEPEKKPEKDPQEKAAGVPKKPQRPDSELLYLGKQEDGKWLVVFDVPRVLRRLFYGAASDFRSINNFKVGNQKVSLDHWHSCPHGMKVTGTLEKEPNAGEPIRFNDRVLSTGLTAQEIAQAKKAKFEEAFQNEYESLPDYILIRLSNPEGKTVGHILSIHLPMPKGLDWNSAEGKEKDNKKARPERGEWEKLPTLLVIHERLYFSTYRDPYELGSWPVSNYRASFTISEPVNLENAEFRFFDSFPTGGVQKLADLTGHKPDQLLKLTKDLVDDRLMALQGWAVSIKTRDFEGKKSFFADISIRELQTGLSPQSIKKVRVGTLESIGEMKDQSLGEIVARFNEQPDRSAPVFLQIEGIPGWIKCER